MEYGKEITTKSYFNNQLKSEKTEYSIPKLIQDKSQVLTEIIKALELITNKQTASLTIVIEADAKTHRIKMMTKKYVVTL